MGTFIAVVRSHSPRSPHLQAATLLSGILPFGTWRLLLVVNVTESNVFSGAAFVELYFVLSSLFASRAYYAFGFLALTAGVVALTTATVTILFTYFILCAEEYRYVFSDRSLPLRARLFLPSSLTGLRTGGIGARSLQAAAAHSGCLPTASSTGYRASRSARSLASFCT